jgi:hypothetical protein
MYKTRTVGDKDSYIGTVTNEPLVGKEVRIIKSEAKSTFIEVHDIKIGRVSGESVFGWVKNGQVKAACHPGHEEEDEGFRKFSVSVCKEKVSVLNLGPHDHGYNHEYPVRIADLRPIDDGALRIVGEDGDKTHIEMTVHGRRTLGWVSKGDVQASCAGTRMPIKSADPASRFPPIPVQQP